MAILKVRAHGKKHDGHHIGNVKNDVRIDHHHVVKSRI